MRIKTGTTRRRRHNKVLKRASGYYSQASRSYKIAVETNDRAMAYAYRDRKNKKRVFRSLWIVRIGAATRANGISYSKFMSSLKKKNIELNRKMLSDMAIKDPEGFSQLVQHINS